MSGIRTFSIEELNRQMRQPTLHPQVAVIDPSRLGEDTALCFTGNYYAVRFVRIQCGEPCPYGRQSADFQYATLAFTEPGDTVSVSREDAAEGDISGILFHPDLFCSKSLVLKKADYTFFGYRDNESLHLSLQEKLIVQDSLEHLYRELRRDIDRYSLRLVSAGLELLLDYCARFYERQFACRTDINRKYLAVLDEALDSYFGLHCQKSVEEGICRMESALSELSPAYLNDLVHAETGKTLAEYIRFRMIGYIRMRVCNEGCPLEQVAGEFGFRQPALSRLEKIVFLQRKPHEMFGTQFS